MKTEASTVTSISLTPDAEATMIYIARVSNPSNQSNPSIAALLRHCLQAGHWSVFEHAHWTVEVNAPILVTRQLLRHKSFSFSEFSQRYSSPLQLGYGEINLRKQAQKNRQSSTDDLSPAEYARLAANVEHAVVSMQRIYENLIDAGVARECARYVLPMGTMSRLYMTGSARSWIHFLQVRTQEDVQWETRQVALAIQAMFVEQFPLCAEALGWVEEEPDADEPRVVSD